MWLSGISKLLVVLLFILGIIQAVVLGGASVFILGFHGATDNIQRDDLGLQVQHDAVLRASDLGWEKIVIGSQVTPSQCLVVIRREDILLPGTIVTRTFITKPADDMVEASIVLRSDGDAGLWKDIVDMFGQLAIASDVSDIRETTLRFDTNEEGTSGQVIYEAVLVDGIVRRVGWEFFVGDLESLIEDYPGLRQVRDADRFQWTDVTFQ